MGWFWIDVRLGIWTFGLLGVWASCHLGIWAYGNLGFWASGHLGFWAYGHLSVHQSRITLYKEKRPEECALKNKYVVKEAASAKSKRKEEKTQDQSFQIENTSTIEESQKDSPTKKLVDYIVVVKALEQHLPLPNDISYNEIFTLFLGSKYANVITSAFDQVSITGIATIKKQKIEPEVTSLPASLASQQNYLVKFNEIDHKRTCCTRARNQKFRKKYPIKLRKCENSNLWEDKNNETVWDFMNERMKQQLILEQERAEDEEKMAKKRALSQAVIEDELKMANLKADLEEERQRRLSGASSKEGSVMMTPDYLPKNKKAKMSVELPSGPGWTGLSADVKSQSPGIGNTPIDEKVSSVTAEKLKPNPSPNTQLLTLSNNISINLGKSIRVIQKIPSVNHTNGPMFNSVLSPPIGLAKKAIDLTHPQQQPILGQANTTPAINLTKISNYVALSPNASSNHSDSFKKSPGSILSEKSTSDLVNFETDANDRTCKQINRSDQKLYYQSFKPDHKNPDTTNGSHLINPLLKNNEKIFTPPSAIPPCLNPNVKNAVAMVTISGLKDNIDVGVEGKGRGVLKKEQECNDLDGLPEIENFEMKMTLVRFGLFFF